jgi:L-methionine (R)-S-oxide reductase
VHVLQPISAGTPRAKPELYRELLGQLRGLFDGERDGLANSANTAAVLYASLPDVNWAGFYFLNHDTLVLGPFQGKIACVRIALGQGVCGTAARRRETLVVPDVHQFPGHIACDAASRSEIVVPLVDRGRLLGVLDLDSPLPARFDSADGAGLELVAALLVHSSDFGRWVRCSGESATERPAP